MEVGDYSICFDLYSTVIFLQWVGGGDTQKLQFKKQL